MQVTSASQRDVQTAIEEKSGLESEIEQHQSIQLRAYDLWEQRGRPWGTPDVDWFAAEHELLSAEESVLHEPPTIAAAKVVGSVLGAVAGVVTSITKSLSSE